MAWKKSSSRFAAPPTQDSAEIWPPSPARAAPLFAVEQITRDLFLFSGFCQVERELQLLLHPGGYTHAMEQLGHSEMRVEVLWLEVNSRLKGTFGLSYFECLGQGNA